MMPLHVVPYNQSRYSVNFSQASVYLDACFFLAYVDSENPKGDKAASLIDRWEAEEVSKVGISNHTFIELVNNIFNNRILSAMVMQRQLNNGEVLEDGEVEDMIGSTSLLVNRLIELAGEDRLDKYIRGEDIRFYVPGLIKSIKAERALRGQLDFHYNAAMDEYSSLVQIFVQKNIHFEILSSEPIDNHAAGSYIRTMQLDAPDALHFAVAVTKGYTHFITMDSDFANSQFHGTPPNVTIIDLAA